MKRMVVLALVFVLLCVGCSPTVVIKETVVVVVTATPFVLERTPPPTSTPEGPSPTKEDAPEPPPSAVTWANIVAVYKGSTQAQWETYCDATAGKSVRNWLGTVVDVRKGGVGYTLSVNMSEDKVDSRHADWQGGVLIIGLSRDEALSLRKGKRVYFSGTISECDVLGGVQPQLTIVRATFAR